MLGIQPKFQTCEKQKNREKKTPKEKKITRTRQYLRNSAICLRPQSYRDFTIIKENYNVRLQCIFFSKTTRRQNPNHKKNGFYILHTGFTMSYKNEPKILCRPKPPLHGLSLSKSPILRVRSGHQLDQDFS